MDSLLVLCSVYHCFMADLPGHYAQKGSVTMLRRCIQAEQIKVRHSLIQLAFFIIPIIPAIMGTFNYLQNIDILSNGWDSLWTQITLFYANFFYAPLIAIYCSYLWRLEHMHNNWNHFMAMPVSAAASYGGKLAIIMEMTLFTQIWISILFFFCGKLIGLPGIFPMQIFLWLLRGTLAAMAIATLQLFLSMVIHNFAIPVGIALLGSIAALLVTNAGGALFWPYSLMIIGMNSNKTEDIIQSFSVALPFFCSIFFFIGLFFLFSIFYLKKTDVRT